jgi:hypothetical protein
MHTHEKNAFSAVRITNSRHRAIPGSLDDISTAIDFFRKQVVAGTMEILYLDVFDTAIKKSLHNGIDIVGHFHAGSGPSAGHRQRSPLIPAPQTALSIGDNQNPFKLAAQLFSSFSRYGDPC